MNFMKHAPVLMAGFTKGMCMLPAQQKCAEMETCALPSQVKCSENSPAVSNSGQSHQPDENIKTGCDIDTKAVISNGSTFSEQQLTDECIKRQLIEPQYSQYNANFEHSLQAPKMASTLEDFEVLSTIGTGSYGTCKRIRRKKDGKVMVWKEMDYGSMSEAEKQLLVSEVNLLRELKHRHIVRYYDRIIDRMRAVIYIVMEYCEGGDLATLIAKCKKEGTYVEEDFAWKILIQTTLALKECHRRKNGKSILHRDLKPANIFLDKHENVKLGDFGLARVLHHETSFAQTYVGTPYYMSPELVNNMSYNAKSDVWALGCLLYEMCALHPPFVATNQAELNRKIRIGDFARIPSMYSSELDRIVRHMIKVEVSQRPSIDEILRDPVVARRFQQIEAATSGPQVHCTGCSPAVSAVDSARSVMAGSGENVNNNSKGSPDDLVRLRQMEEEYTKKLRQLELKEKELESRERSITLREKLTEEKMKRAMDMMEYYRRRSDSFSNDRCYSDLLSPHDVIPAAAPDGVELHESPHFDSCMTKGSRAAVSPKKRVTFDFYGKENLRQKSKLRVLTAEGLVGKYDMLSQALPKPSIDRARGGYAEQLAAAVQVDRPSLDLHRLGLEAKYSSGRNLLFFR